MANNFNNRREGLNTKNVLKIWCKCNLNEIGHLKFFNRDFTSLINISI